MGRSLAIRGRQEGGRGQGARPASPDRTRGETRLVHRRPGGLFSRVRNGPSSRVRHARAGSRSCASLCQRLTLAAAEDHRPDTVDLGRLERGRTGLDPEGRRSGDAGGCRQFTVRSTSAVADLPSANQPIPSLTMSRRITKRPGWSGARRLSVIVAPAPSGMSCGRAARP